MQSIHCMFWVIYTVYRLHVCEKNVEADFCVPKYGLLVQVSYRMTEDATRNREISALQKVGKFLNAKKCMIITYDQEETIPSAELGIDIEVVPVYKFLLAE